MKANDEIGIIETACAICGTNPAREGSAICDECIGATEPEFFPCNRALPINTHACVDYDGTLYACQTCKHPNKQRKHKPDPVEEPEPAEEAQDLPICPHCHEPVNPEDLHPIRKGWHTRCVSESMREAKRAKKAQKKQTKPEPKLGPEPEAVPMIPKTCVDCGEQFAPYKHGSAWPNICLTCMRRRGSDGMRDKWLKKFRDEGMLILDSDMLREQFPKIEQDATACLRTVEAQCLWYILERARKL